MKLTTARLKKLIREELERYDGESDQDWKKRRMNSLRDYSDQSKKAGKMANYKISDATRYVLEVAHKAAKELGMISNDGSKYRTKTNYKSKQGGDVYETIMKLAVKDDFGNDRDYSIVVVHEDAERASQNKILAVDVKPADPRIKKKMEELMGSNPRFAINFI